jgi:hypothetical protein
MNEVSQSIAVTEDQVKRARNFKDLTGSRFGKLKVISFAGKKLNRTVWLCECDCGESKVISGKNMRNGLTTSCGCASSRRTLGNRSTKHGNAQRGRRTRTYKIWADIIKRTTNPNFWAWDRYGGRGIGIHEPWKDFTVFHADVGDVPNDLSIDRIDNDKGYEPGNIRFATRIEQANNRHDNVKIQWRGEIYTLTELSIKTGIKRARIKGWHDGKHNVSERVDKEARH